MEWKPIATAPKDGSDILIVDMNASVPRTDLVHYKDKKWVACSSIVEWDDGDIEKIVGTYPHPTHWMPRPEPPSAPTGKK